ncbi:hypothetical protein LTR66_013371 [Elasticomyces elasticus]|nr:hypothetical protein LTR66_013371 [Elasticomyces elasticus]KAK5011552.1 hypothetical protein LTR28_013957 [Elasticomyces elasticus]
MLGSDVLSVEEMGNVEVRLYADDKDHLVLSSFYLKHFNAKDAPNQRATKFGKSLLPDAVLELRFVEDNENGFMLHMLPNKTTPVDDKMDIYAPTSHMVARPSSAEFGGIVSRERQK